MPDDKFDPNQTIIKKILATKSSTVKWMAIIGAVGTLGGALVALNTFTGLNFRPAWGFEVAELEQQQQRIEKILEKSSKQIEGAAQSLLQLNRNQIELKIKQIEFDRREARRELTELQLQADKYRSSGERIPPFISKGISDTQERLQSLDEEKSDAQARLLQLL